MPDLLAHVLFAYAVALALSLRYKWLAPPYVTAAMAGACIPDIQKVRLLVSGEQVQAMLSVPFDWSAQMTLGGVALSILVGVALVGQPYRRRAGLTLSLGALTHLVTDALLQTPSGRTSAVLWPLVRWHPPTPGLYHSTDVWPAIVAAGMAVAAFAVVRYRSNRNSSVPE